MKLTRTLSIALSIIILAGALTLIIPASANTNGNSANEFYISVSGSDENNGTTHNTAVRTVKRAIELINAAGLGKNDTATVYVDSTVDGAQPASVTDMDRVVSYYNHKAENTAENIIPNHMCTVRFTSYNSTDGAMDYLGYGKMLTRNSNGVFEGYGYYLSLAGPTVFENIVLLDISKQGQYWDNPVNIRNNTAIFSDVKWSYIKESGEIVNDVQKASARDLFYAGNTQSFYNLQYFERSESITQTIAFEGNNQYNLPKSFAFGNSNSSWEYGGKKFNGNTTFVWGIENKTLNTVYLAYEAGTDSSLAFNYNGNVNIVMRNGAKVSNINVKPNGDYITPNITGAVQIVANAGSEINTADIEAIAEAYTSNSIYTIANNSGDITLDVTDTAGTYSVEYNGRGNGFVYYIDADKKLHYFDYPQNLTLPCGFLCEVSYRESLEAIKNLGYKDSGVNGILEPITDADYMLHLKADSAGRGFGKDMAVSAANIALPAGKYTSHFKYGAEDGSFNCDGFSQIIFADWFNTTRYGNPSISERKTLFSTGNGADGESAAFDSEYTANGGVNELTLSFTLGSESAGNHTVGFGFTGKGEIYLYDLTLKAEDGSVIIGSVKDLKTVSGVFSADEVLLYDEALFVPSVYDINSDGKTDFTDLKKVRGELLSSGTADVNGDGTSNICDLVSISSQLKKQAGEFEVKEYSTALSAELVGVTDKNPISYAVGEEITVTVKLLQNGKPVSCPYFYYELQTEDGKNKSETVSGERGILTLKTTLNKAGYVKYIVRALDADKAKLADIREFSGGAGAGFEDIGKAKSQPADFEQFWSSKVSTLCEPNVLEQKEISNPASGYKGYIIKLDMGSEDSAYAYLTYPQNSENGTLKAAIIYHGYGVNKISPIYVKNTVSLSVCAHSMELDGTAEYYKDMQAKLDGYGFKKVGDTENSDKEKVYFKNMLLRDLQAARYIMNNPLWNGKDLTISGGSQGAFQATAVAALCKKATELNITIPWLCDIGGETSGRINSNFRPSFTEALSYYDTVSFAAMLNKSCNVKIEAGLGDRTCPPSGVTALYNAIKAPKSILFTQNRTHEYSPEIAFVYEK